MANCSLLYRLAHKEVAYFTTSVSGKRVSGAATLGMGTWCWIINKEIEERHPENRKDAMSTSSPFSGMWKDAYQ